jgi:hypothetical protein
MGQLTQALSTEAHPVRRARSAWRFVPVALGTAAVLAGCGASDHRAPRAAASSAHQRAANQPAATGQTGPQAHVTPRTHVTRHTHVTPRTRVTPRTHVAIRRSSAKRAPHVAVSSAHQPLTVSQAAVTGQTGPGPQVTVRPSPAKRSGAVVQTATPRPGATIRTINGTSNATIGTLAERTSVFLVWNASEAPIQIITSQGNLLLSSHARSGSIRLAPGTYGGLRVASQGAWTLRLRAAA